MNPPTLLPRPARALLLALALCCCAPAFAQGDPDPHAKQPPLPPNYVRIASPDLMLEAPDGFLDGGDGASLRHKSITSSIEVKRMPAPYAEIIDVFTADELAARGMRQLKRDSITVDGRSCILLHVTENIPEPTIYRWTLLLGDADETYIISGTYPSAEARKLEAPLRKAVLSARWTKHDKLDPFRNYRFSIEPTPRFKFAQELDTLLAFTSDGHFPLDGPGEPLLIIGYELNEEPIKDIADFAATALKETPHCKEITPKSATPIELNGLSGFESTASAKDYSTGTPVEVYQLLLFTDVYHIYMLGIVGVGQDPAFYADFKTIARSLKMK